MVTRQRTAMAGDAPLADRTRQLIADFDAEEKGYPFNYSGDGTAYAVKFAGLLREWLAAHGGPAREA